MRPSSVEAVGATPWTDQILDSVPVFRSDDDLLEIVYRRRWESYAHNVVRAEGAWLITEFHQPGPGRAHGTVNAAAGHHILEGRWLRDPSVVGDYLRYWYTAPEAEPRLYTEWIAWAAREYARLCGTWEQVGELLPGMAAVYEAWMADSLHPGGLYWTHDLADAMEFSISGDGFRPSMNSYQYGNADAIADLARRFGDEETALRFEGLRDVLRERVLETLYDPDLRFFRTIPFSPDGEDAYLATASAQRRLPGEYRRLRIPGRSETMPDRRVRELIGLLPWYFGLPGAAVDPSPAVRELLDPEGFSGPFGLRTAERRHPRYAFPVSTDSPRCLCRWNGPSWPFATSQTLTALARIARETRSDAAERAFLILLRQYAAQHIDAEGNYRIDEDIDPDTGEWRVRGWRLRHDPARADIGRDYQHSTFADLILSGLLGIGVTEDGAVCVDPLSVACGLGRFSVTGLALVGRTVDVSWTPGEGLTIRSGKDSSWRPDLGPLRVPPSSIDRPLTDKGRE